MSGKSDIRSTSRKFRIGSTSYVFPDDILPNVRKLAPLVDDVELVLFEVDDYGTNLPTREIVDELNTLALDNALTYTVHLPLDLRHGNLVSFEKVKRTIDSTLELDPFAYVVHLDGRAQMDEMTPQTLLHWQQQALQTLEKLSGWMPDKELLCVENVEGWDPRHFRGVVARAAVSRCVDIGHLWVQKVDPLLHLGESLPWTRVIHLHGVGSRDHQSLRHVDPAELRRIIGALLLADYQGVLTLEVFGEDDFFSSREILLAALGEADER